jgi:hypothetical protein
MVVGDPLLDRAIDAAFERLADAGYASLSPAHRVVVCVWGACGEIDNGGFEQFFFNTSGDWALETPDAFRAISALELADLVARAAQEFPGGNPSRDLDTRREELDGGSVESLARWLELGSRFDGRTVDSLLVRFIQNNMDEVFPDDLKPPGRSP